MNNNKNTQPEDTIDLKTLFRLFFKRKWWFIGTLIIVLAAGMFYIFSKPVLYEARFNFRLSDDFVEDEYLQYKDIQEIYTRNQSVFIDSNKIPQILYTDLIFKALNELQEIDDYKSSINAYVVNLDLEDGSTTFVMKVKGEDKKLAKKIGLKLIESLGTQVSENDIKIFNNTLNLINADIQTLENEITGFEDIIIMINEEVQGLYVELDNQNDRSIVISSSESNNGNPKNGTVALFDATTTQVLNEITEKQGEILLYKEKIIDNEYEIKKLNDLYHKFSDEKEQATNRVELMTEDPSYTIENNRKINSVIVILLSVLTGIIVVLAVNYIYKLKAK
jgi:hypothetical protein